MGEHRRAKISIKKKKSEPAYGQNLFNNEGANYFDAKKGAEL